MDRTLSRRKNSTEQLLHRLKSRYKQNSNPAQNPPRKYNPEKPPEDNYQEAKWQTDDKIVFRQDDLYTIRCEAELGEHLFDIPIINTDPNVIDSDESYTGTRYWYCPALLLL